MKELKNLIYFLFSLATSIISYTINHSVFWSILAFILAPFCWIKWLIFRDINLTILKESFNWFLK